MSVSTRSIVRRLTRKPGEPYNILTFPTHERQNTTMAAAGHQYYLWHGDGIKSWNPIYAPVPSNFTLLDGKKGNEQLPEWVDFDFILVQSNGGQLSVGKQLSRILHLPILRLEHTTVMPQWTEGYIHHLKQDGMCHINTFISEWSREQWGFGPDEGIVVEHGVDTDLFSPDNSVEKQKHILTVANEYPQRDWCLGFKIYMEVTRELPRKPVGDSPGFSLPAKSIDDLVNEYRSAAVFLNTSTFSPIPTSLLEAMACGCAVVTTATGEIPSIVKHGVNGYCTNNKVEMRKLLIQLMSRPDEAKRLGDAARQTILDRFNMPRFVADWQSVLDKAANYVYTG